MSEKKKLTQFMLSEFFEFYYKAETDEQREEVKKEFNDLTGLDLQFFLDNQ